MQVHALAGGYPRTVNVLCDQCLLRGYASGSQVIDLDTVTVCAKTLSLRPITQGPRNYAFPFSIREIESEEAARPGRSLKKQINKLIVFLIGLACILAVGYLAFRLFLQELILKLIL
jgi:hypothetical protein